MEDYAGVLDDEGKDYLSRVRASSQHLGQLIEALLKLSRMTRREIRRERVDLSTMAQDIAQELRTSQPERQVEFVIAGGLSVDGDAWLLRIALENLLGNAWKLTGGVRRHGSNLAPQSTKALLCTSCETTVRGST